MFWVRFAAMSRVFAIALLGVQYGQTGSVWTLVALIGFGLSALIDIYVQTERTLMAQERRSA